MITNQDTSLTKKDSTTAHQTSSKTKRKASKLTVKRSKTKTTVRKNVRTVNKANSEADIGAEEFRHLDKADGMSITTRLTTRKVSVLFVLRKIEHRIGKVDLISYLDNAYDLSPTFSLLSCGRSTSITSQTLHYNFCHDLRRYCTSLLKHE